MKRAHPVTDEDMEAIQARIAQLELEKKDLESQNAELRKRLKDTRDAYRARADDIYEVSRYRVEEARHNEYRAMETVAKYRELVKEISEDNFKLTSHVIAIEGKPDIEKIMSRTTDKTLLPGYITQSIDELLGEGSFTEKALVQMSNKALAQAEAINEEELMRQIAEGTLDEQTIDILVSNGLVDPDVLASLMASGP
jgi:hypothetical protein